VLNEGTVVASMFIVIHKVSPLFEPEETIWNKIYKLVAQVFNFDIFYVYCDIFLHSFYYPLK